MKTLSVFKLICLIGAVALLGGCCKKPTKSKPDCEQHILFRAPFPAYSYHTEICIICPDGSNRRRLTHTEDICSDYASWSPDGVKILFHRWLEKEEERGTSIWVMDATGANQRKLVDEGEGESLTFSPDGSKIAYVVDDGEQLKVMNSDGSNIRELTEAHCGLGKFCYSWSPDGSQLVYVRSSWELYRINSDGSDNQKIIELWGRVCEPAWSPDGSKIAFSSLSPDTGNHDIYVVDPVGTVLQRFTYLRTSDSCPVWSPDGAKILFHVHHSGHTHEIWVMNENGSDQRKLYESPIIMGGVDFSWSPDGTKIAFSRVGYLGAFEPELYIMNSDGTEKRFLTNGVDPVWQP
jgi:Tol biopolymer transport system component